MIWVGCPALNEKVVKRFGIGIRWKSIAVSGGELHDPIPAFGLLNDAPQRRNFVEHPRYDTIGGDHEILNQLGGMILLLLFDINDLLVKNEGMHFVGLDIERSIFVTLAAQPLRHFILQS